MAREITSALELRYDHPDQDDTMPNYAIRAMEGKVLFALHVMGWMTIIEAPSREEAIACAMSMAPSTSLLPTDILDAIADTDEDDGFQGIRVATTEDLEWFRGQNEPIGPSARQVSLNAILKALEEDTHAITRHVKVDGSGINAAVDTLRTRADQLEAFIR